MRFFRLMARLKQGLALPLAVVLLVGFTPVHMLADEMPPATAESAAAASEISEDVSSPESLPELEAETPAASLPLNEPESDSVLVAPPEATLPEPAIAEALPEEPETPEMADASAAPAEPFAVQAEAPAEEESLLVTLGDDDGWASAQSDSSLRMRAFIGDTNAGELATEYVLDAATYESLNHPYPTLRQFNLFTSLPFEKGWALFRSEEGAEMAIHLSLQPSPEGLNWLGGQPRFNSFSPNQTYRLAGLKLYKNKSDWNYNIHMTRPSYSLGVDGTEPLPRGLELPAYTLNTAGTKDSGMPVLHGVEAQEYSWGQNSSIYLFYQDNFGTIDAEDSYVLVRKVSEPDKILKRQLFSASDDEYEGTVPEGCDVASVSFYMNPEPGDDFSDTMEPGEWQLCGLKLSDMAGNTLRLAEDSLQPAWRVSFTVPAATLGAATIDDVIMLGGPNYVARVELSGVAEGELVGVWYQSPADLYNGSGFHAAIHVSSDGTTSWVHVPFHTPDTNIKLAVRREQYEGDNPYATMVAHGPWSPYTMVNITPGASLAAVEAYFLQGTAHVYQSSYTVGGAFAQADALYVRLPYEAASINATVSNSNGNTVTFQMMPDGSDKRLFSGVPFGFYSRPSGTYTLSELDIKFDNVWYDNHVILGSEAFPLRVDTGSLPAYVITNDTAQADAQGPTITSVLLDPENLELDVEDAWSYEIDLCIKAEDPSGVQEVSAVYGVDAPGFENYTFKLTSQYQEYDAEAGQYIPGSYRISFRLAGACYNATPSWSTGVPAGVYSIRSIEAIDYAGNKTVLEPPPSDMQGRFEVFSEGPNPLPPDSNPLPAGPTGLAASSDAYWAVHLTWDPVPNATSYTVYYKEAYNESDALNVLGTTEDASFRGNLYGVGPFQFTVTAGWKDMQGNWQGSDYSAPVTLTLIDTLPQLKKLETDGVFSEITSVEDFNSASSYALEATFDQPVVSEARVNATFRLENTPPGGPSFSVNMTYGKPGTTHTMTGVPSMHKNLPDGKYVLTSLHYHGDYRWYNSRTTLVRLGEGGEAWPTGIDPTAISYTLALGNADTTPPTLKNLTVSHPVLGIDDMASTLQYVIASVEDDGAGVHRTSLMQYVEFTHQTNSSEVLRLPLYYLGATSKPWADNTLAGSFAFGSGAGSTHPTPSVGVYTLSKAFLVDALGNAGAITGSGLPAVSFEVRTGSTPAETVPTPSGLKTKEPSLLKATVSWRAVQGATGYHIYRGPAGGALAKVGYSNTPTYTDTLPEPGGYAYQVVAERVSGSNVYLSSASLLRGHTTSAGVSLTFNSQGGSAVATAHVLKGGYVAQPANPTRSGYTFGGWYKEAACQTPWRFTVDTVTGNTTVYAKWTKLPDPPTPAPEPVYVPVASVTLSATTGTLQGMQTMQLAATISPANASAPTLSWHSSNNAVAEVTQEGLVTAKKAGAAIITVSTADGPSATCDLAVQVPVTRIAFAQKTLTLNEGKSLTVAPAIETADGVNKAALEWSTSAAGVATVTQGGRIKAIKTGTAKISAQTENGRRATISVRVVEKGTIVKVESVKIGRAPKTLKVGKERKLAARINPGNATNAAVKWKSNSPRIATVDEAGYVTAKRPGQVKITLSAGGKTHTVTITVKK